MLLMRYLRLSKSAISPAIRKIAALMPADDVLYGTFSGYAVILQLTLTHLAPTTVQTDNTLTGSNRTSVSCVLIPYIRSAGIGLSPS